MSGQPPERKVAKFLGVFSFGLGAIQLAAPDRINALIGVKDTAKARAVVRAVGVQELAVAQGAFAFSPPTPVLWSRVVGDISHLALLGKGSANRRAIAAVAGIGLIDLLVAIRYQQAWPKEPTPGESLPTGGNHEEEIEAHVEGHPAITIRATEAEIRPRLEQFEIEQHGPVKFHKAPGDRGTEVIVETKKKTDQIKADLRKVKQLIEVGEIVRSEGSPDGTKTAVRQLRQRPGTTLKEKELEKVGGKN
jgi:hypothetical protein